MSEPTILLCGPALHVEECAASLNLLGQVTLPAAAKFLVTTGKFDAKGAAKGFNVEADYPAELPYLQTLLRWTEGDNLSDPRFRDGHDLYCLRQILARHGRFDFAVVLRAGGACFDARWPELRQSVEGRLFLTFDDGLRSLLIDLRDERSAAFLETAWQLYLTGAVYGIDGYSLDRALRLAVAAVEMGRSLRQRKGEVKLAQTPIASAGAPEASLAGSQAE